MAGPWEQFQPAPEPALAPVAEKKPWEQFEAAPPVDDGPKPWERFDAETAVLAPGPRDIPEQQVSAKRGVRGPLGIEDAPTPAKVAPPRDTPTPETFLGKVARPLKEIPYWTAREFNEGVDSWREIPQNISEGRYGRAALNAGLGALQGVSSPITGPLKSVVGKPVERASGSKLAGQGAEMAAGMFGPSAIRKGLQVAGEAALGGRGGAAGQTAEEIAGARGLAGEVADKLYVVGKQNVADKIEMGQKLKGLGGDVLNPTLQEKLYHHLEDPKGVPLTPEEITVLETHVQPMIDEAAGIMDRIKGTGYALENDGYVHRIAKNKGSYLDAMDPDNFAGPAANPIYGRSLSRTAPSMESRVVNAAEDAEGNRTVVYGHKLGDTFEQDGKLMTVKRATTKEIEESGGPEYHKNALINSADNLLRLRRVERNIEAINSIKSDDRFLTFAKQRDGSSPIPAGWKQTKMPQFEGYYMEPRVANTLNDFYGNVGRDGLEATLSKANRFLTGAIFFNPLPHIRNVAEHWFVSRGWNNVTPKGVKTVMETFPKALDEVRYQGKVYQEYLREGAPMVSADLRNRDFYETMLKAAGTQIEKNPERYGKIAKTLGFNKPADMVKSVYDASGKTLWMANDVFMMQRIMELKQSGMSTKDAIKEASRHIPDYRVPSEVMGSRAVSQAMTNSNLFVFGRYHYGMLKAHAEMIKDLVKNASAGARKEATGQLLMLGLLGLPLYAGADQIAKAATGNKEAKFRRSGPMTLPDHLYDLMTGERDATQVAQSILTPAPGTKMAIEQFFNKDLFTGQPVRDTLPQMLDYGAKQIAPFGQMRLGLDDPAGALASQATIAAPSEDRQDAKERAKRARDKTNQRIDRRILNRYDMD